MSLLLFFSWTTAVENKLQTENVTDNLPKYGLGRRVECLRGGCNWFTLKSVASIYNAHDYLISGQLQTCYVLFALMNP